MLYRVLRPAVFASVFLLGTFRAEATEPKLVIGVYNTARVPLEALDAAFVLAHDAFGAAGLETEWRIRDGGPPGPPDDLVLWILPGRSRGVGSPCALGAAWFEKNSSRALRAEVFYGAVLEQTQTAHQSVMLLSNVIAHEVGHLLLGRAHSTRGLMLANWSSPTEFAQRATLRFEPGEVKRLGALAVQLRTDAALRTGTARGAPDSGPLENDEKRTSR